MVTALCKIKDIRNSEKENSYPESINLLIDNLLLIINRPLGENAAINLITLSDHRGYESFEQESMEKQALITQELIDVINKSVQFAHEINNKLPQLQNTMPQSEAEKKQNSINNKLYDILNSILRGIKTLLSLIIKEAKRIVKANPLYQKYNSSDKDSSILEEETQYNQQRRYPYTVKEESTSPSFAI